jgi:hypothetical protein
LFLLYNSLIHLSSRFNYHEAKNPDTVFHPAIAAAQNMLNVIINYSEFAMSLLFGLLEGKSPID